jgi:hypothetical protein
LLGILIVVPNTGLVPMPALPAAATFVLETCGRLARRTMIPRAGIRGVLTKTRRAG